MTAQGAKRHLKDVLDRLNATTPFTSCTLHGAAVLSFEVEWRNVVGLDYINPLCQDGRVVLEAHNVIKREFESVRGFFPSSPRPSTHHALNPFKAIAVAYQGCAEPIQGNPDEPLQSPYGSNEDKLRTANPG
jgi:hypothetical protein